MSKLQNAAVITPATASRKAPEQGRLGTIAFRTFNTFVYRVLPASVARDIAFKSVKEMKDYTLALGALFLLLAAVSFIEKGGAL